MHHRTYKGHIRKILGIFNDMQRICNEHFRNVFGKHYKYIGMSIEQIRGIL